MVYVGVVAHACGIEMEAVEAGIRREFPGRKAKAAEINIAAAQAGHAWAAANMPDDLPFRVERIDATGRQDPDRGEQGRGAGRRLRRRRAC